VHDVAVPAASVTDFSQTISSLLTAGYNRSDRKYLIWMDNNTYCGIADVFYDDIPGLSNASNGAGAEFARVDTGCWGVAGQSVEAHELMHALGGVQTTAPHSTPYNHCTDESERMCYLDGSGPPMQQVCATSHENVFDCNHDDYFSTAPAGGSYLATHWNTANSSFLATANPSTSSGGVYAPLPPARVLDTRNGTGGFSTSVGPGQTINVQVTGVGGVPSTGVGAVVLNLTVTQPTSGSYLTVYPAGATLPTSGSSINFSTGQTIANAVIAKVGAGGKVSIFNAAGNVHVVVDVNGWFSG